MIRKEAAIRDAKDPMGKAGIEAEKQMAHYLQRAFAKTPDIHVLNDIRLVSGDGDDAAQIDHLVLHRYGFVIIESKSVATKVRINAHGEWSRVIKGSWRGMPSPIAQAKRQAEFLHSHLCSHTAEFLGTLLGMQKQLGAYNGDVVVAVSDKGIIERDGQVDLPEVAKADLAVDRVEQMIAKRKKAAGSWRNLAAPKQEWAAEISKGDLEAITNRVLNDHCEKRGDKTPDSTALPEKPSAPSAPDPVGSAAPSCRHCGGHAVSVAYGRYGYYLKCSACDGNTPIHLFCDSCGAKAKVRKSGQEFFAACVSCGTERHFHTNSAN